MKAKKMQFYFAPNTIAAASAFALNEAGLDYQAIKIDFASGEQTKPEYLKLNPKARVPALVTNQGAITETGAILEYVAALAPDRGLMPSDPFAAAKVREMLHYCASTMHVNHAHKFRGSRWADQDASLADMTAKVPQTMTASCAYVEPLIQGPFLFGEQITIADCHLYTICRWLEGDGVDLAAFPKIEEYMAAMSARASVQKALNDRIIG